MIELTKDAANDVPFMMVDSDNAAVTGLGDTFSVFVRKEAGAFAAGVGTKSELGNGWYNYRATAGECNTSGSFALRITGAGAVQQNLVVIVRSLGSVVWANATRTLTQPAASVAATVSGSEISVARATTWTIPLTGLGSLAGRTKLWFTVKVRYTDEDADALVQVEETAGLVYINAEAAVTAANASLTVTDEDAGNINIVVAGVETEKLTSRTKVYYDVKKLIATGPELVTKSTFVITNVVTNAVA